MHTPVGLTGASSQIYGVNIIPLPKGWVPQQILRQHKCALPHYQAHMLKMLFTFNICRGTMALRAVKDAKDRHIA